MTAPDGIAALVRSIGPWQAQRLATELRALRWAADDWLTAPSVVLLHLSIDALQQRADEATR